MLLALAEGAKKLFKCVAVVLWRRKREGDGKDRRVFADEAAVEVLGTDGDKVQSERAIGCFK